MWKVSTHNNNHPHNILPRITFNIQPVKTPLMCSKRKSVTENLPLIGLDIKAVNTLKGD